MMLLDYVRRYTTVDWTGSPFDDGIRFHPWRDRPFGAFVFDVGLPRWGDGVRLKV